MVEQINLFMASNCDYEEERKIKEKQREVARRIELAKKEREEFFAKNLTSRQHRLVDYLKDNFQSGRFFSIEEICDTDLGYTLNTNPRIHDKCASLGADVRAINWKIGSRYSIIVKDKKGGVKLCESQTELDTWVEEEKARIETKYQYLNNLKYKSDYDGTMPLVNLNDRAIDEEEYEFVEVFKGER